MELGNVPERIHSLYGGKPAIEPLYDTRTENRTGPDHQHAQNNNYSHDPSPSGVETVAGLMNMLQMYDQKLSKEDHRYHSLDGNFRKLTGEHNQLQDEFKLLKSVHNTLQFDNNTLKTEVGIAKDKSYHIFNTYVRPYACKRGIRVRDDFYETLDDVFEPMTRDALRANDLQGIVDNLQSRVNDLQIEVQQRCSQAQALEQELAKMEVSQTAVQSLQNQVYILQQQLLTRVDKVHIVSDDQFANNFHNLVAMVKSLSRSVRITKDTNVLEALDKRGLLLYVKDQQWNTRARKKLFIEAWIWSVLIEIVFKTPFAILGDVGASIAELWSKLFNDKHHRGWPTPSVSCESWRCTTVEHAVEAMSQSFHPDENTEMDCGLFDGTALHKSESEGLRTRTLIANEIGTKLANLSTAADFPLLSRIVEAAFALALQMSLQRSRLQITFPNVGDRLDHAQMAPIPDPDGKDFEDEVVAFIVKPGLTKWGDAYGKHFDQRHDIVPSFVQLQPHVEEIKIKSEPM